MRRTRDRLGDALVELLVQKPFDDITVQDVLDGAGVSRSTFYTHYRDKNDLFLSDVEEFFESMATALSRFGDKSERVAPVQELFAHIGEARPFYNALVESGRMPDVMELGLGHFSRGIAQAKRNIAGPHDPARSSRRDRAWISGQPFFTAHLVDSARHDFIAGGDGQTVSQAGLDRSRWGVVSPSAKNANRTSQITS